MFNAPYYIGVVVPFLLLYIFNCTVFTLVFVSLLRKSYKSKRTISKESNISFVRQQLVIVFTLSVLFGIGWSIGLLATQDAYSNRAVRDVFSALFILITAFHGLFIFIMNGIRSNDVRSVWKKWFAIVTRKEIQGLTSFELGTSRHRDYTSSTNPSHSFKLVSQDATLRKRSNASENVVYDSGTLKQKEFDDQEIDFTADDMEIEDSKMDEPEATDEPINPSSSIDSDLSSGDVTCSEKMNIARQCSEDTKSEKVNELEGAD